MNILIFRGWMLRAMIVVMILCGGGLHDASSAERGTRWVPVFDGTLYAEKPDLSRYGLQPISIIYVSELWRNWHNEAGRSELPDMNRIVAAARRSAAFATIAVLDVEHWPVKGSPRVVADSIGKYEWLLRRFRAAAPSVQVGYYGVVPIRDYKRAVRGEGTGDYLQWQAENDRLARLAAEVDIIFPSLYTFYSDRDGWVRYAREQIREARRFGKPVYVFLWPQYHSSSRLRGLDYIAPEFWRLQLETAAALADGIVIWGGWRDGQPAVWDESAEWWRVTQEFLLAQ